MASDPDWKAGTGQPIERLYAWVAEEPDGGEGVIAWNIRGAGYEPLIGADKARIESYRNLARDTARRTGYPVRLKVFGAGVTIDKIER